MTSPLAYLSGRFLPADQLSLSAADAGFVWGATITDLCRTFHRRMFRLSEHLTRFRAGCSASHVPLLVDDPELTAIAERIVDHNAALIDPDEELILVMFATRARSAACWARRRTARRLWDCIPSSSRFSTTTGCSRRERS